MFVVFTLIFLLSLPVLFFGLISPKIVCFYLKNIPTRKKLLTVLVPLIFVSFFGIGATAPTVENSNTETPIQATGLSSQLSEPGTSAVVEGQDETQDSVSPDLNTGSSGTSSKLNTATTDSTTDSETVEPYAPNGTYTNVDNVEVPSPYYAPSAPSGATALCRDGTYSFSQHRSGTCSHHGGVEEWL